MRKTIVVALALTLAIISTTFAQHRSPPVSMPPIRMTDCSGIISSGVMCWDTDDAKLYVGNGAAAVAVGPGTGTSFIGLTDVPATYAGSGSKFVKVNAAASALEFVTASVATHVLLDTAVHTDTLTGTVVDGDLIIGNATPAWSRLAAGTTGQTLVMGALRPAWGTLGVVGGGTGKASVTANSYLKGTGTAALTERTYSEVKTDLGLSNVQDINITTWAGTNTITTVGALASGSLAAGFTPVTVALGGTNATDAATARTNLGLAIGTNVQAYDADLTTYAGITPSANVQSLLGAADYSAMRTLLSLVPGTNVQAYDADLTTYAGITPSANVQSLLGAADYSAMRTLLSLVPGTNVQAYSATLASLAGLTETNGGIPYGTADNAYAWLAAGGAGKYLRGAGAAAPTWSVPTYANTYPAGSVLAANALDTVDAVTYALGGTKVLTNTAGTITWEDAAAPGAHVLNSASHTVSGRTAGQLLWATAAATFDFSTWTFPAPGAANGVLVSDATNWTRTDLLSVAAGGTGLATVLANSYLKGNGTSALVPRTYAEVKTDLGLNNVDNVSILSWAGSANITTLGTIATGVWGGTAIPVNKGGTGLTAGTSGGIPYYSGTTAMTSSAALAQYGVIIGGGAGAAPYTITPSTTVTEALFATAGAPAFRAIATTDLPTVPATKGGTGVANNVASTITISGSYPLTLTLGASTSLTLPASGTVATVTAPIALSSQAAGDLFYATSASAIARLAAGTQYKMLWMATSTTPGWSAYTFPVSMPLGSVFIANSAEAVTALTSTSGTYYLQNADGVISWGTPAGAGDVTAVGDCASGACNDETSDGGTYLGLYSASGSVRLRNNAGVMEARTAADAAYANFKAATILTEAVDGSNKVVITNNTAVTPTGSVMEIYPEANIWKMNENGTEYSVVLGATGSPVKFGTGVTAGGLLYGSATNTASSSGALTPYGVIYSGSVAGNPPVATTAGTTGQVLAGTTGGAPIFTNLATLNTPARGGTGVANDAASTITITGAYPLAFTLGASASVNLSNFAAGTSTYIKPSAVTYVPLGATAINDAITAATAGDTLILSAGTYTITTAINVSKQINIVGQGHAGLISGSETDVHGTRINCATAGVNIFNVTSSNVRIANMSIIHTGTGSTTAITTANNAGALDGLTITNVDVIMGSSAGGKAAIELYRTTAILRDVVIYVTSTDSYAYGVYARNVTGDGSGMVVDCHTVSATTIGGATRSVPFWAYNNNVAQTVTLNLFNSFGKSTNATALDWGAAATSTTTFNAILNVYSSILNGGDVDMFKDGTNVATVYGGILVNNTYTAGIVFGGTVAASVFTGTITNAANVAMTNESTDTTCFPAFVTDSTPGNFPLKTVSTLTFNSNTGLLSATGLAGAFNGTVGATTPAAGIFTTLQAASTSSLTLGSATGPVKGSAIFYGATSGTSVLSAPDVAGSSTAIVLPSTAGTLALTSGNVATATALAANGANCTAGQFAVGVDASGVAECSTSLTSPVVTTDIHAVSAGGSTVGTAALPFSSVYIGNAATNNIQLTGTAASAKVVTLPGQTGTVTVGPTTTTANQHFVGTTTAGLGAWSTSTYADTYVQGGILHAATANTIAALAPGAVGSFLMSNGASAALSYLAAGAAGQILVGAGVTTIPVWTNSTSLTGLPKLSSTAYAATTSSELAGVLSDEQGTGVVVFSDSPTFVDDITIGAAGVKLTGANGALTILGLGDGADEDVKIDLNTTANTIIISSPASSATDISLSALNLATTGTIQGGIKIVSDADGMDAAAMTAAGMYGTMFIATGAGTWILPAAVTGMSICLMDSGTAHDLILDVTAGSTIRLKGTEQADGVGITNAAGTSTGDFVCVIAVATGKWSTVGIGGTWASQ